MNKKGLLIDFIEKAKCFDNISKLKLILFATGVKPSTFVALKINEKTLHDKHHFEKHLKENKIVFNVSRPKSFEEISAVKGNRVIWKIKGVWYGYDLFKNKKLQEAFKRYVQLLRNQQHSKADILAGKIYGYPSCCIKNYVKEHDKNYLIRRYTYYQYYKKISDMDRSFPFLNHTPCSVKCSSSAGLNKRYAAAIKKCAQNFWKEYTKKQRYSADLLVSDISDIYKDRLETKSIWQIKNGYEYALIAKKPYNSHYYMYSYLTKKFYQKGTVLSGVVAVQYSYANIKIKRINGFVGNLHHERRFKLLGRK